MTKWGEINMISRSQHKVVLDDNLRLRHAIALYGKSIDRKARLLAQDSIINKAYDAQQKAEEISSLASLMLQGLDERI